MKDLRVERTNVERTPELAAYYATIVDFPKLTIEQEIDLAIAAQAGNQQAKDMLVNCNLRFVVSVAKQYNYCRGTLSILDLINEGNIGLIDAVDTFDITIGVKFISHAVVHIRKRIILALKNSSRVVRDFHATASLTHTSLDAPAYDDADTTLADVYCQHTDKESDESLLTDILRTMQAILGQRESYILCRLYGIDGTPATKSEIADHFGLTTERVRQIHERALAKLRNNDKAFALLAKYM